jgi:aspartate aminotransferase
MQSRLAKRAQISVSPIRKIFQQLPAIARQRLEEGLPPLIDLSIGQPHIPANPAVMKSLNEMQPAKDSYGYSSAQGEAATLEAIVKLYNLYYPLVNYKNEETMVTIGGSGALSNIFSILVENENDVILTFEPYFGAYTGQVKEWGGSLKKIPTLNNHFRPTAEGLDAALKDYPNAKALILNYPNNPSGISLTRDEMTSLARVLENYPDMFIIIDDVYRDFNYQEHFTILDVAPHLKDRCIVINSGAKGLLGAPGERVGMVAAHADLIRSMLPRQTNGMSSVPYRTQAALRFAVENHFLNPQDDWLMSAKNEYKTNVTMGHLEFKKQGFSMIEEPNGAFYLLVNAKHLIGKLIPDSLMVIKDDCDIANYFLLTAGVATVPGSGFGIDPTEGYLRISCAKEKSLILEAANRMGASAKLLLDVELIHHKDTLAKPSAPSSNLVTLSLLSTNRNRNLTGSDSEFSNKIKLKM